MSLRDEKRDREREYCMCMNGKRMSSRKDNRKIGKDIMEVTCGLFTTNSVEINSNNNNNHHFNIMIIIPTLCRTVCRVGQIEKKITCAFNIRVSWRKNENHRGENFYCLPLLHQVRITSTNHYLYIFIDFIINLTFLYATPRTFIYILQNQCSGIKCNCNHFRELTDKSKNVVGSLRYTRIASFEGNLSK